MYSQDWHTLSQRAGTLIIICACVSGKSGVSVLELDCLSHPSRDQ